MASSSQQSILGAFTQAAGPPSQTNTSALVGGLSTAGLQGVQDALSSTAQVIDALTQATSTNTEAVTQNSQTRSSSSTGSAIGGALSTASQVLGGGLSALPLVSLFTSLFGGGGSSQPAPLLQYSMPSSLNLQSTANDQPVVWGANGLPQAPGAPSPSSGAAAPGGSTGTTQNQQVTVQVNAIDSQSFLDHSTEIAQAVRQAMLNMSSLNDVVSDL
jgi:hypothetical protein